MKYWKRFIPLLIILLLMGLVYASGWTDYISFDTLKEYRRELKDLVQNYPIGAPLLFTCTYALATALSLPGGLVLSVFGGFLFPQPYSTIYVVTGATIGAVVIFLAARTALGDFYKERAGESLKKMRDGFQENAWSYLLFLRLTPLFPFWLVNIAPAFFNVSLFTYTWTTFIGIIPGAFVYTQAGKGLGTILDVGEEPTLGAIINTDMQIALAALGIFVLIPTIIKWYRKK